MITKAEGRRVKRRESTRTRTRAVEEKIT